MRESNSIKKRLLSLLLTAVMVMGFIPATSVTAYAATDVIINVKCGGVAVAKATVAAGSVSNTTDESGSVTLSIEDGVTEITVSADGYTSTTLPYAGETSLDINLTKTLMSLAGYFSAADELTYDGSAKELIKVSTELPEGVSVSYTLNGETSNGVPTAIIPGSYTVGVSASGVGYENLETTYNVTIGQGKFPQNLITAVADVMYNGKEHELVNAATFTGSTVTYTVNGEPWTGEGVPKAKDAGEYKINYSISMDNYETLAPSEPLIVKITKAIVTLEFTGGYKDEEHTEFALYDANDAVNTADFSAAMPLAPTEVQSTGLKYNASTGITIGEDGKLSFVDNSGNPSKPGVYYVIAKYIPAADHAANYSEVELKHYVSVYDNGSDLLKFAEEEQVWSAYAAVEPQQASTKADDNGKVIYSAEDDKGAISFADGKITADADKMLDVVKAAESTEGYSFTVKAEKAEGTITSEWHDPSVQFKGYDKAEASYTANVKLPVFANNAEILAAYELGGDTAEGWYNKELTVTAKDGYKLAAVGDSTYSDKLVFKTSGTHEVYIIDTANSKAYGKTTLIADEAGSPAQIDTTAPKGLTVKYLEALWAETLGQVASLNVFQPDVKVKVQASDEHSGIAKFEWTYKKEFGTGAPKDVEYDEVENLYKGQLSTLEAVEGDDQSKCATLILSPKQTQQLKGQLNFKVFDKAGNSNDVVENFIVYVKEDDGTTSENKYDDNITVVVDGVKPTLLEAKAEGSLVSTVDSTDYYDDDVNFSFSIEEVNINKEDVELTVTKDGTEFKPELEYSSENKTVEVDSTDELGNPIKVKTEQVVNTGKFTLTEDGTYTIKLNAKDFAGNKMAEFTYDKTIVIDTKAPELKVGLAANAGEFKEDEGTKYLSGDLRIDFEIVERNFDAASAVATLVKDNTESIISNLQWKNEGNDRHTAFIVVEGEADSVDGNYAAKLSYKDFVEKEVSVASQGTYIVDKTAPLVTVNYPDGTDKTYYKANSRTATVKVVDNNFKNSTVNLDAFLSAKDVNGKDTAAGTVTWNVDTATIVFPEGNHSFVIDPANFTDLAGNKATVGNYEKEFTVDATAPTLPTLTFSDPVGSSATEQKWYDKILENVLVGFWKDKATVTATITEAIAGLDKLEFSYAVTNGVSTVNQGKTIEMDSKALTGCLNADGTYVVKFDVPANFNGHVSYAYTDKCGNKQGDTAFVDNGHRVVVDNISPTANVSYDDLSGLGTDGTYYRGAIGVAITVTEANFFSEDIAVTVNGNSTNVQWTKKDQDVSVGSFSLDGDGEYTVGASYSDRSGNAMANYTSQLLIIDTEIEKPEIQVNGEDCNGKAYNGDADVSISYYDDHFDSCEITVTHTSKGKKNVDVSDKYLTGNVENDNEGGYASFEIPKDELTDGLYTVTAVISDKAGNSTSSTSSFTVNRFGSVYEYDNYLIDIIRDGGQFLQGVTDALRITEYNTDKLVEDSVKVEITRDGKPLDNVIFEVSPSVNNKVERGESGWFEYLYSISPENFKEDGVYKVSISSKDAAGNSPESSDMQIQFYVDGTAPEITSVSGLEEAIVNAEQLTVKYTIFDTIGLKSVKVYVDGKLVGEEVTKFEDGNNYESQFTLYESVRAQSVRIVVEDLAGNVTDTDDENFTSVYTMEKKVTVTTNALARFYANKPLFWGVIAGIVLSAAALGFIIPFAKKKKRQPKH